MENGGGGGGGNYDKSVERRRLIKRKKFSRFPHYYYHHYYLFIYLITIDKTFRIRKKNYFACITSCALILLFVLAFFLIKNKSI